METTIFVFGLLLAISFTSAQSGDWTPYKDEIFIKIFPEEFIPYTEAMAFCEREGGSLVIVKEADLEPILNSLTETLPDPIVDTIWLGGKRDNGSTAFVWHDGSNLTYTDWLPGYPRPPSPSGASACIVFHPVGNRRLRSGSGSPTTEVKGTWSHSPCTKRNIMVMCQKEKPWELQDAVKEIISLKRNPVPLGFIYVEYYGQPSPDVMWPSVTWEDVTPTYAGLFFRALGSGSSAEWGVTQEECAPRITGASYRYSSNGLHSISQVIPSAGWSDYLQAGEIWKYKGPSAKYDAGVRFFTDSCEVRPRNQAIRIWKRTA